MDLQGVTSRGRYIFLGSVIFLCAWLLLGKSRHKLHKLIFGYSQEKAREGDEVLLRHDGNYSLNETASYLNIMSMSMSMSASYLNKMSSFEPFKEGSVDSECIGHDISFANSMKARTAIVLSGKYTAGHLAYSLESISRAFDTSDIEVFIYALYVTDDELEDMKWLIASRSWIVSVLFERWSDDLWGEMISEMISKNGGEDPDPVCCLQNCCYHSIGWECKETLEVCKIRNPRGYPAIQWSMVRGWRLSMSVWERYVVKVRKGNPHRIMIRARMDTVFPTVDRAVDWGGEAADYLYSSTNVSDIWVPWSGRDLLADAPPKRPPYTNEEIRMSEKEKEPVSLSIQEKVVVGKPLAVANVFKEVGLHIGDTKWRTEDFAETMFWVALINLGFAKDRVGRFTWTVSTVRQTGRAKGHDTEGELYFHHNCLLRNDSERNSPGYPGKQIKNLNLYGFPAHNFGCSCRNQTGLDITNDEYCTDTTEVEDELRPDENIYPEGSGLRFCGPFFKLRNHTDNVKDSYVPFINDNLLSDWP